MIKIMGVIIGLLIAMFGLYYLIKERFGVKKDLFNFYLRRIYCLYD